MKNRIYIALLYVFALVIKFNEITATEYQDTVVNGLRYVKTEPYQVDPFDTNTKAYWFHARAVSISPDWSEGALYYILADSSFNPVYTTSNRQSGGNPIATSFDSIRNNPNYPFEWLVEHEFKSRVVLITQ